ncbi:hypothetical protein QVD17_35284 [Tagetes erecta]|uniref:Uncharacterized protein n=1 Tax=Tagetes erecta TaxID=13708 RepID=A0AAD8JZ47_TARER|nr:hypothetical protein QVD17_35284 [Tagetes erecta]
MCPSERTVSFNAFSPRKSDLLGDALEGTKHIGEHKHSSDYMHIRRPIMGWVYVASLQAVEITRSLWNKARFTLPANDLFFFLSDEDIEELVQIPMDNPTNDKMGKMVEAKLKTYAVPWGQYTSTMVLGGNNQPVMVNHQMQGMQLGGYNGLHASQQHLMVNHQQKQVIATTALDGYHGVNNNPTQMINHQQGIPITGFGG